jgi:hypothetical protein
VCIGLGVCRIRLQQCPPERFRFGIPALLFQCERLLALIIRQRCRLAQTTGRRDCQCYSADDSQLHNRLHTDLHVYCLLQKVLRAT